MDFQLENTQTVITATQSALRAPALMSLSSVTFSVLCFFLVSVSPSALSGKKEIWSNKQDKLYSIKKGDPINIQF